MASNVDPPSQIFNDVTFAIIPSDDFDDEYEKTLVDLLTARGATCLALTQDLRPLTHLITSHVDFEAYHDAIEGFINVVSPAWVFESIARKKAASPRQYNPDPQFFFHAVIMACADDVGEGDKDAIMAGVLATGGQYSNSITKLVTHLVANSLDAARCKIVADKKLKCIIVSPVWFDHCLRLGKKIDVSSYCLTEKPPPDGPPLLRKQEDLEGASQYTPDEHHLPAYPTPVESPSKARRGLKVFRMKAVFLHEDLKLGDRILDTLTDIIKTGGGTVVEDLSHATVLVCQFRGSPEFISASREGLEVGNLNWLYYLITRNRWTAPTNRLLHYPYPLGGIDGFEKFRIALSNYSGEARVYLESLIKAAGGQFTRTMASDNTHLITAHLHGEKCAAADEWHVERVNHLWLEESYARQAIQKITRMGRYSTFPDRVNLGEVVGQTEIDRGAIRDIYFPTDASLDAYHETEDVEMLEDDRHDVQGDEAAEDEDVDMDVNFEQVGNGTGTPASSTVRKSTRPQAHKTPVQRLIPASPLTSRSRAAKARAVNKLHAMASDIALFEKESKRVGGVIYGGRRVTDPDRIQLDRPSTGRKRSISSGVPDIDDDRDESPIPAKKAKVAPEAQEPESYPVLKILATGFTDLDKVKSRVKNLNLRFVESPFTKFDVLVAPMIQRTHKFLCGLATAPIVAQGNWLIEMGKQSKRLPVEDYLLTKNDTTKSPHKAENVDLPACLSRAMVNKQNGGLLKGWTIFMSPNDTFNIYKDIVEANGGTMLLFKGHDAKITPWQAKDEDRVLYLVMLRQNEQLLEKFKTLAERNGFRPQAAHTDWLCEMVLKQMVPQWKQRWEDDIPLGR